MEAYPEPPRPAATVATQQPATPALVATCALLSDHLSDLSRMHSAVTLVAILPLPQAAALLACSDSKSSWPVSSLICRGDSDVLQAPVMPGGPAYRAVSLCASPGFQALFGARSSLACDVFFHQLMESHQGARSFFTQVRAGLRDHALSDGRCSVLSDGHCMKP